MKSMSYDGSQTAMPFFAFENDACDQKEFTPTRKAKGDAFVIGVCGGTASGKTSVCSKILEQLQKETGLSRVVILSQDSYYKDLAPEARANVANYNFDHPDAFDWDLIELHLTRLKHKKPIEVPHYSFVTHSRLPDKTTAIFSADVVLFEGILVFWEERIRRLMDMKVFVDTDDDVRLIRRIRRDIASRGRTLESVLGQYEHFVKPAFDQFIAPTKRFADVVVPRGETNTVAIELIVLHIRDLLALISKKR